MASETAVEEEEIPISDDLDSVLETAGALTRQMVLPSCFPVFEWDDQLVLEDDWYVDVSMQLSGQRFHPDGDAGLVFEDAAPFGNAQPSSEDLLSSRTPRHGPAPMPPLRSVRNHESHITSTCASTVVTVDSVTPRETQSAGTQSTASSPRGQPAVVDASSLSLFPWEVEEARENNTVHVPPIPALNRSAESHDLSAVSLIDEFQLDLDQLMSDNMSSARQHLSDDEVQALPHVRFDRAELQSCSICLERFNHGMLLSGLGCGHMFHVDCLAQWVRRSVQCPNCRWAIQPMRNSPANE